MIFINQNTYEVLKGAKCGTATLMSTEVVKVITKGEKDALSRKLQPELNKNREEHIKDMLVSSTDKAYYQEKIYTKRR